VKWIQKTFLFITLGRNLLLCFLAQCSHIQNHRTLEMGNGTASLVRGVTNYWIPWLQCQDKQLLVNLPTWQNRENFNSGLFFSPYCIWKEVDGIHVHLCVPNRWSIFMKILLHVWGSLGSITLALLQQCCTTLLRFLRYATILGGLASLADSNVNKQHCCARNNGRAFLWIRDW
jgi:hypothetical protein